ncbi:hypothetical protein TREMEDRAFT_27687 [Tremella mesenterica DSM 1558]|uniref:uncharacterized protein n=1 Tax=Tremella mesenterica (strain ATCC 24925 / CBS 8224 / DSM 1558 / NBRC 9311 / NRRL Y-6157 / RJB 2259-6 / UBC 559-6) TaxID=578456 RepID=UPI0003F495CE|nr:uncharacterized protein TREMEDRAFT_27687 [Tremella mesenterica DSM 1558]EIW71830.1 hypothetical protein TREMEDRAFT_27687 [Tremella mesenterica DSM 1558]
MPRHTLHSLHRSFGRREHLAFSSETSWDRLDRVQVLGEDGYGHTGCVNALSWSDDGSTLLSGSDDKKICIWKADPSPTSGTATSPHPLRLTETITTGHWANIFSARLLPNTNTPTIVSCAGDRDVRVFEVERLGRAEDHRGQRALWGVDGPGVRILKCHRDRTKRIATENSPHLFMTVSEDGTVRQHDLRIPHRCKDECPDPLFRAPGEVDLYSLSVSLPAPYMFAVAGRTDCAFICDRRMTERQHPSWGSHIKSSGQVHCVRRLGLSEDQWNEVGPEDGMRYNEERHITCVKMSPDKADEVIVAFARHSTALFSIYDSPESPNIHSHSPTSIVPPITSSSKASKSPRVSNGNRRSLEEDPNDQSTSTGKRRHSVLSTTDEVEAQRVRGQPLQDESLASPSNRNLLVNQVKDEAMEYMRDEPLWDEDILPAHLRGEAPWPDDPVPENVVSPPHLLGLNDPYTYIDPDDDMAVELDAMGYSDSEENHIDWDEEEDYDEDEEIDEDYYEEMLVERNNIVRSGKEEFREVEMILPKRCFKGARNMETVKDCNFLGNISNKVCTGSDDGNFFVWDKDTGRLVGIWEGDGSVVNGIGIDDTVKMFAPTPLRPLPSFVRTHMKETIIRSNLNQGVRYRTSFGRASLLQMLTARGMVRVGPDQDEDLDVEDEERERRQVVFRDCTTQ